MALTKEQKLKIRWYFEYIGMKIVDISKIYGLTPARIRQILIAELGEDKYKKQRNKIIKANDVRRRYREDEDYRKLCIERAKARYRRLKH